MPTETVAPKGRWVWVENLSERPLVLRDEPLSTVPRHVASVATRCRCINCGRHGLDWEYGPEGLLPCDMALRKQADAQAAEALREEGRAEVRQQIREKVRNPYSGGAPIHLPSCAFCGRSYGEDHDSACLWLQSGPRRVAMVTDVPRSTPERE